MKVEGCAVVAMSVVCKGKQNVGQEMREAAGFIVGHVEALHTHILGARRRALRVGHPESRKL